MEEIIYIRLINGDEIFAKLCGLEKGKLLISEPLIMETIQSTEESTKYMFMSRFSPYTLMDSMGIDLAKIVHFGEVSEIVRYHYYKSLEFAKEITDIKLLEGMAEATQYLSKILKTEQQRIQSTLEDLFESATEQVLDDLPTSPTKH